MAIQFVGKTVKVGNSLMISIPKEIVDYYKYSKGELLSISIKRPEKDDRDKGC